MSDTPFFALARLVEGQALAAATQNHFNNIYNVLIPTAVIDRDLATPPGSPAEGDVYIVATGGTGAWAGKDGQVAIYFSGWYFFALKEGWHLYIKDEDTFLVHDGTAGPAGLRGTQQRYPIMILTPGAAEDRTVVYFRKKFIIDELRAVLRGSASPSVTWTLRHDADRNATGTEVITGGTTTTNTTTGQSVTTFNSATIALDRFLWLETTATGGTVAEFALTVSGRMS